MAYQKPVIGALSMDSENCGCCFFVDGNGQGFFFYSEGLQVLPGGGAEIGPQTVQVLANQALRAPETIQGNNIASVGDNSASVTPLANTGLPATQPIIIGVPAGVSGVQANVGPSGQSTAVNVDTSGLALTLLGTRYDVPLV